MEKKELNIFCDGSCLDNGKASARGGWSVVVSNKECTEVIEEFYGKLRAGKQTNNRAELEAMLLSMLYIERKGDKETFYSIYSDSDVAVGGILGTSARNANRDIWEQIEEISARIAGSFTVVPVKNDKKDNEDPIKAMNNHSDKLARQGANSLLLSPIEVSI